MGSRKEITLKEIASRVGVSVSTASRALQEHPSVRADVRRSVKAVADELGYEPARKGGHRGLGQTVGVVVPSIKVPYYARLVTGVLRVADTNGYECALRLSRYKPSLEERQVQELMDGGVEGIIVVSSQERSSGLRQATDAGLPVIYLDRVPKGRDACVVSADETDAGYEATRYLMSLGHRELFYLSGPDVAAGQDRKFDGVSRALGEAGIQVQPDRRLEISALQVEPTIVAVRELLNRGIDFTAIVASDDVLAFGAHRAAVAAGYAVPDDMSIVGINGNRMSGGMNLTTVMLPAGQIGRAAMQMVIDLKDRKIEPPQLVSIKGSLVVRGSCAPPRTRLKERT